MMETIDSDDAVDDKDGCEHGVPFEEWCSACETDDYLAMLDDPGDDDDEGDAE